MQQANTTSKPVELILTSSPDLQSLQSRDANGNVYTIDATGGSFPGGVRPMQLLLSALASCAIVDVLIILKKQKQEVKAYLIRVTGERETEVVPALWSSIHLEVSFEGGVDPEKADKALKLSLEKYCSVAETLRRSGTKISSAVIVNKNSL